MTTRRSLDPACSCPDAGQILKAKIHGVEPPPCAIHTAAGRIAAAEADMLAGLEFSMPWSWIVRSWRALGTRASARWFS